MSEKDHPKPYHARGMSSGQETADVVADVLKHAAERDEAAQKKTGPKPQPRWMLPLSLNLALLSVYFLAARPSWTVVSPIQPPPPAEQIEMLKRTMYMSGIVRIESFFVVNGRLPTSLQEAGAAAIASTVDYVVHGESTYTLISSIGDEVISYDSGSMTVEEFTGPFTLPG